MAASSMLTSRTLPPVHRRLAAPAAASPPPKPPTMMLAIERFMASAMSLVRMPPDAPTRAPAMISTGLSITKPAIAAAVPVNELSSEMTTGMSAPPMGRTMRDAEDQARPATTSPSSTMIAISASRTTHAAPRPSDRAARARQPRRARAGR